MTAYRPKSTDWKVSGTWQCEAEFEPIGATDKRVTYLVENDKTYAIGFVKMVAGIPFRVTSEPFLGSVITGGAPTVEIQCVIPTEQRQLEWWMFTP